MRGARAAAPQVIGGDAQSEEDDGDDEVAKLIGDAKGEQDRVGDDGSGSEDEQEGSQRIAGYAIANRGRANGAMGTPQRKNGRRSEPVENPADEDDAAD